MNKYKENWNETKDRFSGWWNGASIGRPILSVLARRKELLEELEPVKACNTPEEAHLDIDMKVKGVRNFCRKHHFLAESFPNLNLYIAPGTMAAYLGAELDFRWDAVWYKECVHDWKQWGQLRFDPDNFWWKKHLELMKKAVALSQGDFTVLVPDIMENVDVLLSMRGAENLCYDLMDSPDLIMDAVKQIDNIYFKYYDAMYDIVKDKEGGSSAVLNIWGPGKAQKLQCDFSAMMSPAQFREFYVPTLRMQCRQLDYSLYHLDGPDAVKHLETILKIDELQALQWMPGAGQPDGGNEKWYPIYDKTRAAGKSLWIEIYDGGFKDWVQNAENIVKRYGPDGIFMLFPIMEEEEAYELIGRMEKI